MEKLKVGILGATGMVGQNYISLLENHPWFEVTFIAASELSKGKTYSEAVTGRWHMQKNIPENIKGLIVNSVSDTSEAKKRCSFVFSALDSAIAKEYEPKYAKENLPVISNASAYRNALDVPMLIPEINSSHIEIIPIQQKNNGWQKGFIAVKPNCSLQSYLTPLYALHEKFGIKKVMVTTMQAVSGAGHPGVSSHEIIDNIIPFISGEEEKTENEPMKILGKIIDDKIVPESGIKISAHCNRVPVIDGHMACVSVEFEKKPDREEMISIWKKFRSVPQVLMLPSSPAHPIIYKDEPDRPQTRLDRNNENGMAITVGRLRECNIFHYRFVGLSHNTIRGAAGGGILNAELLYKKGFIR